MRRIALVLPSHGVVHFVTQGVLRDKLLDLAKGQSREKRALMLVVVKVITALCINPPHRNQILLVSLFLPGVPSQHACPYSCRHHWDVLVVTHYCLLIRRARCPMTWMSTWQWATVLGSASRGTRDRRTRRWITSSCGRRLLGLTRCQKRRVAVSQPACHSARCLPSPPARLPPQPASRVRRHVFDWDLCALLLAPQKAFEVMKLKQLFDKFDVDGSGGVDMTEFQSSPWKLGNGWVRWPLCAQVEMFCGVQTGEFKNCPHFGSAASTGGFSVDALCYLAQTLAWHATMRLQANTGSGGGARTSALQRILSSTLSTQTATGSSNLTSCSLYVSAVSPQSVSCCLRCGASRVLSRAFLWLVCMCDWSRRY